MVCGAVPGIGAVATILAIGVAAGFTDCLGRVVAIAVRGVELGVRAILRVHCTLHNRLLGRDRGKWTIAREDLSCVAHGGSGDWVGMAAQEAEEKSSLDLLCVSIVADFGVHDARDVIASVRGPDAVEKRHLCVAVDVCWPSAADHLHD